MSTIHIDNESHLSVCDDSRGTTQIAYTRRNNIWHIAGLTAEQCDQLAVALAGEASRQRKLRAIIEREFWEHMANGMAGGTE
jgi:hypothetical protein